MAIKPFAIQGADLTLGGVNLQAGTTGVVIPGVTQAVNYFVEEVERLITIGGNNPDTFGSDANAVTIIDNSRYLVLTGTTPGQGYVPAEYSVDELDDGRIEKIDVEVAGTFAAADKTRAEAGNMWATTTPTPFVSFNTANWTQIPYRPKMRAGAVENVGGDIGDIVVEVDSEATKLSLANKDFTLETTRTGTQDADINLIAADDIFIEARGDDLVLSAADQVRINTRSSFDGPGDDRTWRFDSEGRIEFPDGTFQTTAYPGNNDVWVQKFKTAIGAPADIPIMTTSVEYLGGGDIVALFIHSNQLYDGGSYSGVARFTSAGELVWSMSFTGALYTTGWGLAVDNANGYIYVAGNSSAGFAAVEVATLTKLNQTNGSKVWSCAYDVGVSNVNAVVDVASDGSPVVVGFVESEEDDQVVTSKINATDGSVTWSRAIDGQGDENAYGMAVGPTGEIVTVGYMTQFGISDAALTLYADPVSNANWVTTATVTGASGATYNVSFTGGVPTFTNIVDPIGGRTVDSILDTVPGATIGGETGMDDMIVKVGTVSDEPDDRMLIVKYNSTGAIQWQKAVQVNVGYNCTGADADIDSEGNIYVCGNFEYNDGITIQSVIIIKFNSLGVKQWTRKITGDCGDFATSIVVGPDNFLYLSAVTVNVTNTNVNMVIAKYERDGDVEWQRLLSNTTGAVFAGEFFINSGGGSNLAVKDGYVAVGGGFGDLANFPYSVPNAIVAQVGSHGAEFLAGNFNFSVAGFSGNLDSDASNITVVDAGKTDSDFAGEFTVSDFDPNVDLTSDLIGTLYHGNGGENRLFNGGQSLILETTGAVTLPKGGTITEGVVTSNPTIQLTPARPDVASQKLVIKGGGIVLPTTVANNNIELAWSDPTAIVGDTVNFTIVDSTTYANQTLYWWIYPENAGIGDSNFGTVAIDNNGDGAFSILIDSDDYEFTVRVSPENNNYDPDNLGVESYPINASEPTYPDYHLHLTTGNLAETSIFLGTDNHNVRTTVIGDIQITTPDGNSTNVWEFGNDGKLTAPGNLQVDGGKIILNTGGNAYLESVDYGVNSANSAVNIFGGPYQKIKLRAGFGTEATWTFGTDGKLAKLDSLTLTAGGQFNICTIATAGSGYNTGSSLKATTGGSGTGMTVGIGYGLSNQLTSVSVVNPGTGYVDGDVITVSEGTGGTFTITRYNNQANQGNNNFIQSDWVFNAGGTVTFPNATVQTTAYPGVLVPADGDTVSGNANLVFYAGTDWYNTSRITINPTSSMLTLNGNSGTGGITFPDATVQTTAWAGGRVVAVPTASTGAAGNKQGDLAFNSNYIYYCTANYTDGLSNIWKRIAWSGDTW